MRKNIIDENFVNELCKSGVWDIARVDLGSVNESAEVEDTDEVSARELAEELFENLSDDVIYECIDILHGSLLNEEDYLDEQTLTEEERTQLLEDVLQEMDDEEFESFINEAIDVLEEEYDLSELTEEEIFDLIMEKEGILTRMSQAMARGTGVMGTQLPRWSLSPTGKKRRDVAQGQRDEIAKKHDDNRKDVHKATLKQIGREGKAQVKTATVRGARHAAEAGAETDREVSKQGKRLRNIKVWGTNVRIPFTKTKNPTSASKRFGKYMTDTGIGPEKTEAEQGTDAPQATPPRTKKK